MRVSSRVFLVASIVATVLIVVLGFGGVWLGYQVLTVHADTPTVRKLARVSHFPVARVGSDWITYDEYLAQADAQSRYMTGKEAQSLGLSGTPTNEMRQAVYEQLIRVAAIEDLARKYAFEVTPLDVDRAFDDLVNQAGTSTQPGEIQAYLRDNFGWDEKEFKAYIVRPAFIKNGLADKRQKETGKEDALETEINERVKADDVRRWMKFN